MRVIINEIKIKFKTRGKRTRTFFPFVKKLKKCEPNFGKSLKPKTTVLGLT